MTVFVTVAEAQSFAAAARKLSMSAPAVSRVVAELEQQLGVILLLRTTRTVRVTEAGQRYLSDVKRILSDIKVAEESAAGTHSVPHGQLVITAPVMFGRLYIMPIVTAYVDRYPEVSVSALFLDRNTNLLEEGIDVAIRIGELPDSSLRAIRLGSVMQKTYASSDYLKQRGVPTTPQELNDHRLIASTAANRSLNWSFKNNGQELSVKIIPAITATTNDAVIAAAKDGFGITRVLSYQAASHVKTGLLQPILEDYDEDPIPVNIVHPQGRSVPAKVRVFMDMVVSELADNPALGTF